MRAQRDMLFGAKGTWQGQQKAQDISGLVRLLEQRERSRTASQLDRNGYDDDATVTPAKHLIDLDWIMTGVQACDWISPLLGYA
jgi:streptomycin 6-kinase